MKLIFPDQKSCIFVFTQDYGTCKKLEMSACLNKEQICNFRHENFLSFLMRSNCKNICTYDEVVSCFLQCYRNKSLLWRNNNWQNPKYGLGIHLRRSSGSKPVGVESIFQTN